MSDEYVLITTLSHFKLKYAIPKAAFDTLGYSEPIDTQKLQDFISSGAVREFSQNHLGEVVADVSVYDQPSILEIFDTDNAYLKNWTEAQKLEFINKWQET